MSTHRSRRRPRSSARRAPRPVVKPMQYVERLHSAEVGDLVHITSWAGITVTAQLPSTWLAAGRLPSLAPGAVRELVPTVYMSEYSPILDVAASRSDDDEEGDWWCSEAGTITVRGALIPPAPFNADLQTFLLDVAGRPFPLNWTNPEPFLSSVIEATGGLYLDPRLDRGGLLGPTGDWSRAPWRVAEVRRYPVVDGAAGEAVAIERTPDPWDVEESSSYVVDLVAEGAD